jgi:hypothetical protein
MAPSKKRAAVTQTNTLLNFFGGESSKANSSNQPTKRVKREDFGSHTGLSAADAIIIDDSEETPYKPFHSQTPKKELSVKREEDDDFGEPLFTLAESSRPHLARDQCSSSSSVSSSKSSDSIINVDPADTNDDDWARGDDEIVDADEEDDFTYMEELRASPGECEMTCPICGLSLVDLPGTVSGAPNGRRGLKLMCFGVQAVDQHVNECLDKSSKENVDAKKPQTSSRTAASAPRSSNVFSVLMSSHKENEAWKEATIAEDKNFKATKANGGRRKAPFYKVHCSILIAMGLTLKAGYAWNAHRR